MSLGTETKKEPQALAEKIFRQSLRFFMAAGAGTEQPRTGAVLYAAKPEKDPDDSGCSDEYHRMEPLGLFADRREIVKDGQKNQVGDAHQIQDIPGCRVSVLMEHDQCKYGKSGRGDEAGGCRAQPVKGVLDVFVVFKGL